MPNFHKNTSRYISYSYCTNVGVLASELSQKMCMRNNLNFIELLRPFCKISQKIKIPNKENSTLSIDLQDFQINLIDIGVNKIPAEFCATLVDEVVRYNQKIPKETDDFIKFYNDLPGDQDWYDSYVELISRMIIPIEEDYIHALTGCIIVATTHEFKVLDTYTDLNNQLDQMITSDKPLPNSYIKFFERNIFRYYVLLHDPQSTDRDKLEKDIKILKGIFGSELSVIVINTGANSSELTDVTINPWYRLKLFVPTSINIDEVAPMDNIIRSFSCSSFKAHYTTPELEERLNISKMNCGKFLSLDDQNNIKLMMNEFIVNGLIPHLANTLNDLHFDEKPLSNAYVFACGFLLRRPSM
ncbi:hypothetical protein HZS_4383, partial [Henneguya salminicola]